MDPESPTVHPRPNVPAAAALGAGEAPAADGAGAAAQPGVPASPLDPVLRVLGDLNTAEKVETAYFARGLESGVLASLRPAEIAYFRSAVSQEYAHSRFLTSLGAAAGNDIFYYPPGSFTDRTVYLETLLALETTGTEAYSAAVYLMAARLDRPALSLPLAQILGIETEHRVLLRSLLGLVPANNFCFEPSPTIDFRVFELRIAPFLSPGQFSGGSTPGVPFPDSATVRRLAGADRCVNPGIEIR